MNLRPILIALAALLAAIPLRAMGAAAPVNPAAVEFFEKKVRPLLVDNCYNCHSAFTNAMGGLRVDDRNGLILGGDHGPSVVPGSPQKSLLFQSVTFTGSVAKMPPGKQLAPEEIEVLKQWIEQGVAWPPDPVVVELGKPNPKYDQLRKEHWAWQPIQAATAPPVADTAWPRDDIDRFVLAALEARQLKPTADADRTALIRRVTFDLTGLPPAPREIKAFIKDHSADAFEKVVDRLLASHAFGERWGRHWLDVARYAESTGPSRNVPYPQAWRYRDYVIDAFNHDKPYDQFVREQIAGDLLPAADQKERDECDVATGFLALGVHDVNQRFKIRFVMDNVDEQIDTVTRSMLAMTASCARCHDHKFDPIPTSDYYALAGIFFSSDLCAGVRNKMGGGGMDYYDSKMLLHLGPALGPDPVKDQKIEQTKKELAEARKAQEALSKELAANAKKDPEGPAKRDAGRQKIQKLEDDLFKLNDPASDGLAVLGVREAKSITDTEIRIRGQAERLGPVVQRGFLSVAQFSGEPTIEPGHSGRLELANWLANEKNPLTARVMANRVWHHLFGQGLVRSVDNFGTTGDRPSNPQLLDSLATRFMQNNWSVKKLVRAVVLSRTYQLSSREIAANVEADPSDRLIWRQSPRRLDAEEIRDAMLAAAGNLDLAPPRGSPVTEMKVMEFDSNSPQANRLLQFAQASVHRSVYLPLVRGVTPTSLEVFDLADQTNVTGNRDATTVATQALYLLNDPFVRRQALDLANHLLANGTLDDAHRIKRAYRLTLGRAPTSMELARAQSYLSEYEEADRQMIAQTPPPADARQALADGGKVTRQAGESGGDGSSKPVAAAPAKASKSNQPAKELPVQPATPRAAAWASLCQALFGSAEFRYLK